MMAVRPMARSERIAEITLPAEEPGKSWLSFKDTAKSGDDMAPRLTSRGCGNWQEVFLAHWQIEVERLGHEKSKSQMELTGNHRSSECDICRLRAFKQASVLRIHVSVRMC